MESLSSFALMNLKWLVKLRRRGHRNGAAFDINPNESEILDVHPTTIALRELEKLGYVILTENELMRMGWTIGADLTEAGIQLAEDESFDDSVPPDIFPWP